MNMNLAHADGWVDRLPASGEWDQKKMNQNDAGRLSEGETPS